MKLIQSVLTSRLTRRSKLALSLVLDNGDIYHFYCLSQGIHWVRTSRYRGRYEEAVRRELGRSGAKVVAEEEPDQSLAPSSTPGAPARSPAPRLQVKRGDAATGPSLA